MSQGAREPIRVLADGTIKQVNPLSGTQVWTVPGRGNRPLAVEQSGGMPLDRERENRYCAFCSGRYTDTPPEKSRLVRGAQGWRQLDAVPASALGATTAEFRRVPNLFEILSLDYWEDNHGYRMGAQARQRMERYLQEDEGRAHVMKVARAKALASGLPAEHWDNLAGPQRADYYENFFAGGHDVIIARRHFTDGATWDNQLAASGSLTPEEHRAYVAYSAAAAGDLWGLCPEVRFVAIFQNWLRPAGASFDHLHKQLVAIDERGVSAEREARTVAGNPGIYNELAVNYAAARGLLLAENEHAIAFAGFGHRFPTLEVYSKSARRLPWEHSPDELAAISDLLYACHAATGPDVPTNEEWHYQPRDLDAPMPLRIMLKWRTSTLAGFEGGTKINVNTVSPFTLHGRVAARLATLAGQGLLPDGVATGESIRFRESPLRYLEG